MMTVQRTEKAWGTNKRESLTDGFTTPVRMKRMMMTRKKRTMTKGRKGEAEVCDVVVLMK